MCIYVRDERNKRGRGERLCVNYIHILSPTVDALCVYVCVQKSHAFYWFTDHQEFIILNIILIASWYPCRVY